MGKNVTIDKNIMGHLILKEVFGTQKLYDFVKQYNVTDIINQLNVYCNISTMDILLIQ